MQCGCSELKIANSPGTLAFCETPVAPEANGDLILTEANTCVLTCDGHFVTEISCGFNEADGGTSWFSNMDNADPEIIEGDCCLEEIERALDLLRREATSFCLTVLCPSL